MSEPIKCRKCGAVSAMPFDRLLAEFAKIAGVTIPDGVEWECAFCAGLLDPRRELDG